VQHTTVDPARELDEFLAQPVERRWLIPDLLERGDRVIIVGAEGTGKTTLVQQFAVCAASGLHPWTRVPLDSALRVLIVDLENPATIMMRNLNRLRALAGDRYQGGLFIERRPQGMDLTTRRDARWLDALVALHAPDLLILTPLYKMFAGAAGRSKASEESAEMCAQALDEIRVRHDCALLIEAHAPHGTNGDRDGWRPIGSSLWLRWPEFGFGLRPVSLAPREVNVVRWRGDRDVGRDWPVSLVEGHAGMWPWEAA
jgi:replicative DNA helicase